MDKPFFWDMLLNSLNRDAFKPFRSHSYTVSQFATYVFAMSHENRATPLKVSQKGPVEPV